MCELSIPSEHAAELQGLPWAAGRISALYLAAVGQNPSAQFSPLVESAPIPGAPPLPHCSLTLVCSMLFLSSIFLLYKLFYGMELFLKNDCLKLHPPVSILVGLSRGLL